MSDVAEPDTGSDAENPVPYSPLSKKDPGFLSITFWLNWNITGLINPPEAGFSRKLNLSGMRRNKLFRDKCRNHTFMCWSSLTHISVLFSISYKFRRPHFILCFARFNMGDCPRDFIASYVRLIIFIPANDSVMKKLLPLLLLCCFSAVDFS